MWKIEAKTKIPIYSWAEPDSLDDGTLRQIKDLANLPFAYHHVALMPDAHVGYGMPIGGVLASIDYIVPNAVGVDIGCGMVAVKTSLTKEQFLKFRERIGREIFTRTPLGFRKHSKPQKHEFLTRFPDLPVIQKEKSNIKRQLGTLGGGNHFIDVLFDTTNFIWIMIHSGSRNIGKKIADVYHKRAKEFTRSNFDIYPSTDLAALPVNSKDGQEYITGMQFAQDFAYFNRQKMLESAKLTFLKYLPDTKFEQEINIHHNYAAKETHFGKEVWIHRKGAISAKKGELGIVPGSMATNSYITKGLEEKNSFHTSSHGAGRKMGRKEAKRKFSIQQVHEALAQKDILLFSQNNAGTIEEFSGSYKDIDEVIDQQKDLTEIQVKMFPLMVIIG